MEASILVKKVYMDCPICDKTHEVEERKRIATITLKGEKVSYEERYYYCANADEEENEFETGTMTNENLLNARNAYRVKHGLLTSDEIVAIREGYGLSQVDLARLLGWGEATISRYESKAIQDEAYDNILRLIKDNPLQALELLKKNAARFTYLKQFSIRKKIIERLDTYGKEYLSRQSLEGEYADYEEPSDYNGQTLLNIDKVEAMISYIAEMVPLLYKVKLMKILWYSDAVSFKENGKSISGLVYKHESYGALPIGHYCIMNLEALRVEEEIGRSGDLLIHILPTPDMDYSVLNECEKRILDRVIGYFKEFKAKDIINYMHKEKAYQETNQGDIIPFSLAKEIREFQG